MKTFYFWYCVVIILVATAINYSVAFSTPSRSWVSTGGGSTGGGYTGSGSGWHK